MTRISILFDNVIAKLNAQGARSYDSENDMCKYHDGKGNCCLFGHMISDEYYEAEFEGLCVTERANIIMAIQKSTGINLTEHLMKWELNRLQEAHDLFWDGNTDFKDCIPDEIQQKIWS